MPELYKKAQSEMRPGAFMISNSFVVPDAPTDEMPIVDDGWPTLLHLWRMSDLKQKQGSQTEKDVEADNIGDGGKESA